MAPLTWLRSRRTPPTDAIAFRVAVCATVVVSVAAALGQQAVPALSGIVAILLIPAGCPHLRTAGHGHRCPVRRDGRLA